MEVATTFLLHFLALRPHLLRLRSCTCGRNTYTFNVDPFSKNLQHANAMTALASGPLARRMPTLDSACAGFEIPFCAGESRPTCHPCLPRMLCMARFCLMVAVCIVSTPGTVRECASAAACTQAEEQVK